MRYLVFGYHILWTNPWNSPMDGQILKVVAEQDKDWKFSLHEGKFADRKDDKADAWSELGKACILARSWKILQSRWRKATAIRNGKFSLLGLEIRKTIHIRAFSSSQSAQSKLLLVIILEIFCMRLTKNQSFVFKPI